MNFGLNFDNFGTARSGNPFNFSNFFNSTGLTGSTVGDYSTLPGGINGAASPAPAPAATDAKPVTSLIMGIPAKSMYILLAVIAFLFFFKK